MMNNDTRRPPAPVMPEASTIEESPELTALQQAMTATEKAMREEKARPKINLVDERRLQHEWLRSESALTSAWHIHLTGMRGMNPFIGPRDQHILNCMKALLKTITNENHDFSDGEKL